MKVHSSHDIEFTVQRQKMNGRPNALYMSEQIATAQVGDGVVIDIGQSLNRMVFFIEHPNGDNVIFSIKELIDVAAHILLEGHPAEPVGRPRQ